VKKGNRISKNGRVFCKYPQYFILPEATEGADPAWFAFIVTVKEDAPFKRDEITRIPE